MMSIPSGQNTNPGRDPWGHDPSLEQARRLMADKGSALVVGLEGPARAFALARAWLARPKTWLTACPTLASAEKLARDLEFFLPGKNGNPGPVRLFPAYEVSPYHELDPPPEVTARRLAVLWELLAGDEPVLVVTSARGLTPRLPPPEHLVDNSLGIETNRELERDQLVQTLVNGGYTPVSLVEQVGDFAVRGSVVDFFGPLLEDPVRVEFFGDEVASLRSFDPADQRSQLGMNEAQVMPCHPVDLSPEAAGRAVEALRKMARRDGLSTRRLGELVERMELRAPFSGLESFLTLYFDRAGDIFDYLPGDRVHCLVEPADVEDRLSAEARELEEEHEDAREQGRIVLPPPMLRRTPEQVLHRLHGADRLEFKALGVGQGGSGEAVAMRAGGHVGLHEELGRRGEGSLLGRFCNWAGQWRDEGRSLFLVCRSRAQIERLAGLLTDRGAEVRVVSRPDQTENAEPGCIHLLEGALSAGFTPRQSPIVFVTEDEVFGAPRIVRRKPPQRLSAALAALDDLKPGDYVVHVDHGIGKYQGMSTMAVGPAEGDFLLITYKGGDKLYLPADRLGLISKYRGPEDAAPSLERLGGKLWSRTKKKVQKAVEAIARDLVELYAARSHLKGHAFEMPGADFREFEAGFPFTETPDQAKAIEEVIYDLTRPKPMDRLVCGDVGYGKTEVAIRAAFIAAMQGRQVAVLVPTTVLAEQHAQTFAERLDGQPLVVESLSRFKTPVEQKRIVRDLAQGSVDIVIGTHRIIQKDVVFKNLGLLVVDEEHRFGVKDKERLKKLRRLVDVLTLTATPIPRTMQMSLSGIRDFSVINTAPRDRQAIKTYLARFSPRSVSEAIDRELKRGGQVFFVHNRVEDIGRMARLVQKLAPAAKIGIGHGQMNEKALEKVMMAFVRGELDVLVCTTIIESGLDIPNANTIIINNADHLGLSQIYQLRGRVGRSGQKAYAYLFIKSETSLTSDAKKRLKALMDFTHLGAGFAIAMHDLQIRGAGNLLGEVQSGQVAEVGYELYVRMLEEAVGRLKGQAPSEGPEPELHLGLPAHLPEEYVPESQVRLSLYKRLSRPLNAEELGELATEIADRFGPPPGPVKNLLASVELKSALRRIFAVRLDLSGGMMHVEFTSEPRVDLDRLLGMAEQKPQKVKVYPEGKVSVALDAEPEPLRQALEFLHYISVGDNRGM